MKSNRLRRLILICAKDAPRLDAGSVTNDLLYNKIKRIEDKIEIYHDNHGNTDFMESFKAYMGEKGKPDLFCEYVGPTFVDSANEPIIQLADFVAGTLLKIHDTTQVIADKQIFNKLLEPHKIVIENWPLFKEYCIETETENKWDAPIEEAMRREISNYFVEHDNSDEEINRMQVATLMMLLYNHDYEKNKPIHADAIIDRLEQVGYAKISKQVFTANIIGAIRDKGIIIAGGHDGYRLATTQKDIQDYMNHDKSIIEPMLYRLDKAIDTIRLATKGDLNVFEDQQFIRLGRLATAYKNNGVPN